MGGGDDVSGNGALSPAAHLFPFPHPAAHVIPPRTLGGGGTSNGKQGESSHLRPRSCRDVSEWAICEGGGHKRVLTGKKPSTKFRVIKLKMFDINNNSDPQGTYGIKP